MALNLYEAAKRTRNPMAAAIFKAIVTEDALFSLLPFVGKDGSAFSYNREKALPTAEWVSPTHTALTESAATFEEVVVPKREIATDMDIYNFVIANQGGDGQVAAQLDKKTRAVGRLLADNFINGAFVTSTTYTATIAEITATTVGPWQDSDRFGPGTIQFNTVSGWRYRAPGDREFGDYVAPPGAATTTLESDNPSKKITITTSGNPVANVTSEVRFSSTSNEPDGLLKMIPDSQVIDPTGGAAGDAYDLGRLDQLLDLVKIRTNLAFVMRPELIREHKAVLRGLGGANPEHVMLPSFGASGASVERPVLAYDGIPILKSENIPDDTQAGGASSSIYLVSLSEADGGVYAGCFSGSSEDVDLDPFDRAVLGLNIVDVGHLEDKNARRWRATWYGGFALGSELAAARAEGIQH